MNSHSNNLYRKGILFKDLPKPGVLQASETSYPTARTMSLGPGYSPFGSAFGSPDLSTH